ncbi:MAG: ABC transporter ATP-binding protein [Clostridium sp.]|uniref:ABC transporter ATP-binding protein n=1 Tax=Clostridium sp. TaxID=1506 RepID=UPI002FCB0A07
MIEVKDLSKTFGDKVALKDVNINFMDGNLHGIVGVNGSGKSTLLKCITGIYKGEGSLVKIDGKEVYNNNSIKEALAYIEDENNYFNGYRITEVLKFYKLTYPKFSMDMFNDLNKQFNINIKSRVRRLSKGQKMRLSIMLGLAIQPKVIVLDEPTNGLDPIIRNKFLNILVDYVYENKATAIIASHNLSELERMCDSITLLDSGQVRYSLTLDDLKQKVKKLQVMFKGEVSVNHPSIVSIEKIGRVHYLVTNNYDSSIIRYIESLGAEFIEEVGMSLEDMFLYTVGGEYSELV